MTPASPFFFVIVASLLGIAPTAMAEPVLRVAPFSRGVNLTHWFDAGSVRDVQFSKFCREDFENVKKLGADVVRLPIDLLAMTSGAPGFVPDPLFLEFLDQAVSWAEELGLYVILDNHTVFETIPSDSDLEKFLMKAWTRMAAHYKARSNHVLYEIYNEPRGIEPDSWGAMQGRVIEAIRAVDKRHTIVVGPANSYHYLDLRLLPEYADRNLLYTFHFYDPMLFTHQGVDWTEPSLVSLTGVPFPPDPIRMPSFPASLKGTWVEECFRNYPREGTARYVRIGIDAAADFAASRGVPVFCGELGVSMTYVDGLERASWYRYVRGCLDEKKIAWTSWDYYGRFGLYKKESGGDFGTDLNVSLLMALGFTVPPQKARKIDPEKKGFDVCLDYASRGISTIAYSPNGIADFYSRDRPYSGKFSLCWKDVLRYDAIAFSFMTEKDCSVLADEGYALEMMVRKNGGNAVFDVRFVNPGGIPGGMPWRMSHTIDTRILEPDGVWHKIRIPLAAMEETGAWKESWFPPEGSFSWKRIERFEIAAEHQSLDGIELSFDDIRITR